MSSSQPSIQRYHWIIPELLPQLPAGTPVVLFGAGQGSVELLQYNTTSPTPYNIVAVADNDATMHGKTLAGIPIIAPATISEISVTAPLVTIVTTISGAGPVSAQLTAMGYREQADFFSVGRYPAASATNFHTFWEKNRQISFVPHNATILHVGPGGFLGLECALYAAGYAPCSMDAYAFGVDPFEVSSRYAEYTQMLDSLLTLSDIPFSKDRVRSRFTSLFHQKEQSIQLDRTRIPYYFPHRFSALPLEDSSVDVVLSFAVLEHVRKPEKVVQEIARVLKPGGTAFQRIITCDHRSYSKVKGYHPFSYLLHTEAEWEKIATQKFYQNRLLPHEWKALFSTYMQVEDVTSLIPVSLPEKTMEGILKFRKDILPEHLRFMNCDILVRKK